jgi:hypothetical protein
MNTLNHHRRSRTIAPLLAALMAILAIGGGFQANTGTKDAKA